LEADVKLLNESNLCDVIFAPKNSSEMYEHGRNNGGDDRTIVNPTMFNNTYEGMARPSFFSGVATVVTKLFNIVKPSRSYFGQKDAAQCVCVRRVVEDLDIDTEIIVGETVREGNGLAMSSRNAYLSEQERTAAGIIYQSLRAGEDEWRRRMMLDDDSATPTIRSLDIVEFIANKLRSEPLIHSIEYISTDSIHDFSALDSIGKEGCVVSLALNCGEVRLIDNIIFGGKR
jgi:pantoate--beta-alanine ligase